MKHISFLPFFSTLFHFIFLLLHYCMRSAFLLHVIFTFVILLILFVFMSKLPTTDHRLRDISAQTSITVKNAFVRLICILSSILFFCYIWKQKRFWGKIPLLLKHDSSRKYLTKTRFEHFILSASFSYANVAVWCDSTCKMIRLRFMDMLVSNNFGMVFLYSNVLSLFNPTLMMVTMSGISYGSL